MQLAEPEGFFDSLREGLFAPSLSQPEVDGCNMILRACSAWCLSWTAYGLGTAFHETAHTMQPVREIGSDAYLTRMYDPKGLRPEVAEHLGNTQPGDGILFAGRGYVQLTGRANYARASTEVGRTLVSDPDLALRPDIAAQIMVRGMAEGWFTGRKLVDFLPTDRDATRAEYMAARRIINGQDRADLIAHYALGFADALKAGGWS